MTADGSPSRAAVSKRIRSASSGGILIGMGECHHTTPSQINGDCLPLLITLRCLMTVRFNGLEPASDRASRSAKGASRKSSTGPEILLRQALTRRGRRYRIDASDLVGRPDIVFRRTKVAVFVDGDFWHGRNLETRLERLSRGHNAEYWVAKVRANAERDARTTAQLQADGWLVVRLWEGDIRADPAAAAVRICELLDSRERTSAEPSESRSRALVSTSTSHGRKLRARRRSGAVDRSQKEG